MNEASQIIPKSRQSNDTITKKNNDNHPIETPFHHHIGSYTLMQVISLTVQWLIKKNSDLSKADAFDCIYFNANTSLAFPGSDVSDMQFYKHEEILYAKITLNLLSLHGSSSPLPPHFAEASIGDDKAAKQTRDFFDLFHHRLHRLLHQIWLKYRYHEVYNANATDIFSTRMFALIGLGHHAMRTDTRLNWQRLLPYMGLLSQRSHSAALIESVLRYYFQHKSIRIEQCVPRQVPILRFQQNQLGLKNSALDNNMLLGESITDRSLSFRIHITHLNREQFNHYLPGADGYEVLKELVQFTLKDPLDYDVFLKMQPDAVIPTELSNDSCCLGQTSWLGKRSNDSYSLLIKGAD